MPLERRARLEILIPPPVLQTITSSTIDSYRTILTETGCWVIHIQSCFDLKATHFGFTPYCLMRIDDNNNGFRRVSFGEILNIYHSTELTSSTSVQCASQTGPRSAKSDQGLSLLLWHALRCRVGCLCFSLHPIILVSGLNNIR